MRSNAIVAAREFERAEVILATINWPTKATMRGRDQRGDRWMPVLYGRGNGQFAAIGHLLAPLGDLSMSVPFGQFENTSFNKLLSRMSMVYIPELGNFSRTELGKLGAALTTNAMTARRFSSRSRISNAIASTGDDRGTSFDGGLCARPFVPIACREIDLSSHTLAGIDALTIWRSIDENERIAEDRVVEPESDFAGMFRDAYGRLVEAVHLGE